MQEGKQGVKLRSAKSSSWANQTETHTKPQKHEKSILFMLGHPAHFRPM